MEPVIMFQTTQPHSKELMKKAILLTVFATSVLSAGCETTSTNTTSADRQEGETTIGSRIPRRAGSFDGAVGSMGRDTYKPGQLERSGSGGMQGK
jgi:hypothetical protein